MKKILLTGATDGIGLETAKKLAELGHHLLIHGRNESKLADVQSQLTENFPDTPVDTYSADLSDFSDIRSLLQSVRQNHGSIDVIINNAGVYKTANPITKDGLDVRFVVNTFAPYIIAKSLLSLLADDGRIINLSSAAQAPVSLESMKGEANALEPFDAYAQSKLAITIWSQEVAKTLKPEQVILAVNPGSLLASKMVKEGFGVAGKDIGIGANILVRSALAEEFANASGQYFDNDTESFAHPHPDAQNPSSCDALMMALNETVNAFYGELGS